MTTKKTIVIQKAIEEHYLPNPRCKKTRKRRVVRDMEFRLPIVTEDEFPIAMIVSNWGWRNAPDEVSDFGIYKTELRWYEGSLYSLKDTDRPGCPALAIWP